MTQKNKGVLLILVIFQLQSSEGFTDFPVSRNVTVDTVVEFNCGHPDAEAVIWTINGTQFADGQFPDLNVTSYGNRGTSHLFIVAHLMYTSTEIECTIFLPNSFTLRTAALLSIQGKLGQVSNLHRHNLTTFSWVPPSSLDITDVNPDIVYCVEIYNITCGGRLRIAANCSVFVNYFSWNLSTHDLYEFDVTPRSNVDGVDNGTSTSLKDQLPTFLLNSTILTIMESSGTAKLQTVLSTSNDTVTVIIPPMFIMLLYAVDGLGDLNFTKSAKESARGFNLTTEIAIRRLWNISIVPYGFGCAPVVYDAELSSHDIQAVVVTSQHAGKIEVTGQFLQQSTASGILIITASSEGTFYDLKLRDVPDLNFENIISGLPGEEHTLSLFVVKKDGLPFERVATRPRFITVLSSTEEVQRKYTIEPHIEQTSTGVCITCTFIESFTTYCVAVVHQRISQLNSSGLMNIESSYKFIRSGDTASGCIEGVHLEDYQVGVVGGRQRPASKSPCVGCIVGPALPLILCFLVVSIIIIAIVCRKLHKKSSSFGSNNVANDGGISRTSKLASHSVCELVWVDTSRSRRDSGISQPQSESFNAPFLQISIDHDSLVQSNEPSEDEDHDHHQREAVPESAYAEPPHIVRSTVSIPSFTEGVQVPAYTEPEDIVIVGSHFLKTVWVDTSDRLSQPQPESLNTPFLQASFDDALAPSYRASEDGDDDHHQTEVVIESGYAEPPHLVRSTVSIPSFSDAERFRNPELKKEVLERSSNSSENKTNKSPQYPAPLTPSDADNLRFLLRPICFKWEELAKALLVDEDLIDEVNISNKTDEACLQEVIDGYFDNSNFEHDWEEIVTILREINEEQLADKICDLHVYHNNPLPGQTQYAEKIENPVEKRAIYYLHQNLIMDPDCEDQVIQKKPLSYISVNESPYFSEAEKKAHVPFLDHQLLECDCNGREYTNIDHDITLRIPEGAVAEGEKIHFEVGVAMYGPFIFPEDTQPISPILWLCILEGNVELKKPFQVVLPHCLNGLSKERLQHHQVGFAKASHNYIIVDNQMTYTLQKSEIEPIFAFSGCRSYAVLESNHCCFYCLVAKKTAELAKDTAYCLTRIEFSRSPMRCEVYFCATYFLDTCLRSLEEQFPSETYKHMHYNALFKFKDDKEPLQLVIVPQHDQCVIAMEPANGKIEHSDINDFWLKKCADMQEMHKRHMYPPRLKMTISLRNLGVPFKLLVKFNGHDRGDKLDTELIVPLDLPCLSTSSPSVSTGSRTSALSEPQSHTVMHGQPRQTDVLTMLIPLASSWRMIGALLGLESGVLDTIKHDEQEANNCLQMMVSTWLKQVSPIPTWKNLADTVEKIDPQKARNIRDQFCADFCRNTAV